MISSKRPREWSATVAAVSPSLRSLDVRASVPSAAPSLATAATIGLIGLPEMRKRGYSDALATGSIAAGGTLGSIIPPSGALIVFGILAEQSIGKLFTAAIIPGLSQALFYVVTIVLLCRWRPSIGPATARAPWSERRAALSTHSRSRCVDSGRAGRHRFRLVHPHRSGLCRCDRGAGPLCMASQVESRFSARRSRKRLRTTGMIYVVIIGALIFAVFMSFTGLAEQVADSWKVCRAAR